VSMQRQRFSDRFRSGQTLYGTFLKVPATMPAEIIGSLGYDFIVVDEEHSPFNRETTDRIILACKAAGLAAIVRVQSSSAANILSVLDCGADGVLVPHVCNVQTARAIVAAGRYRGGQRGYAPTTRAGNFGSSDQATHMEAEDRRVTIIAMIEDPEAIDKIDEIVAVEGIDGVFIGRGDLEAAYAGTDDAPLLVRNATKVVCAATARAGRRIAVLPATPEDAARQARDGATAFILSSDQGFLRSAAMHAHTQMSEAIERSRVDYQESD